MKKILLGCAVISLLSSNAFAGWDIHKGRLINEKKWATSNNVRLTFDPVSTKKNPLASKENSFSVITKVGGNKGSINVLTPIKANHEAYIFNCTNQTKTYFYQTDFYVNTGPNKKEWAHYQTDIELQPGGWGRLNKNPVMHISFEKPGNYQANIGAHVTNIMNPPHDIDIDSYSSSNIEIS